MESENLIIFKGATIEALLHNQEQYLEITFTGGMTQSAEYQTVCNQCLAMAKEKNIRKWFIDQTLMNIHPRDLQWLFEDWVPRLIKEVGAWRTTATVLSKNLFGEFMTKQNISHNVMKDAEHANAGFFKSREEAIDWLLNDPTNAEFNDK
jgi:hypothetical protein